jgi:hypothetical protein
MTTHLYCVLPDDTGDAIPPGLSGLAGARVRALPVDGLVAWVSDVARDVPVSIDEVRSHDAVVEAALETGSTPVPARYGQRFDDDDACRAALANRADSVEPLVAGMQGFVEMTLIVTPSTRRMLHDLDPVLPDMVEPESEGVGRRYLEALRKREMATAEIKTAMDELAGRLAEAAGSLVRRATIHQTVTPMPLRTISHLVSREDLPRYRAAVDSVHGNGEFRFLVIGPRAPYSFSALSDSGGAHGMNLAD